MSQARPVSRCALFLLPALLAGALTGAFTGGASAQSPPPQQLHLGLHDGDALGRALDGVGDCNGDGVPDLAAGAPQAGVAGKAGYVRLLSGKDGAPLAQLTGSAAGDLYGAAVAGAGDADADGHADLIAGAPRSGDAASATPATPGAYAELISGATGAVLFHLPGSAVEADGFGAAVDGLGDITGDGHADLVIGAPLAAGGTGRVVLVSGESGGTLLERLGDKPGDLFGSAVSAAGDSNADGTPDVAVGAVGTAYVRLFSGKDGALLREYHGPSEDSGFGHDLHDAGDLDGDGFDDLAIAVPGFKRVDVMSGKTGLLLRRYERELESFASAFDVLGDMDGDGTTDFAIGAPLETLASGYGGGATYLISGATGITLFKLFPEPAGAQFGAAVARAGDADGDGRSEILVGAPLSANGSAPPAAVGAAARFAGELAGSILPYGLGCPNLFTDTPRLDLLGDPHPDGKLTITLSSGPAESFGIVFLGNTQSELGLANGCVLWVQPLLASFELALPESGEASVTGRLPTSAPPGLVITLQAFCADEFGEGGFTTTAAIKLTVL